MAKKHVVTIGGGTGTFVALSGLKKFTAVLDLKAVVSVADDGGSTGRLMDEFGKLPVGDVRMALAALSESDVEPNLIRELFLYRFDRGEEGLKGHNLGNLLLVALTDMLGSEAKAVEEASKILNICGTVLPVSESHAKLVAEYANGKRVVGEAAIDSHPGTADVSPIRRVSITPHVEAYQPALDAILNADLVLVGPGDLYTSIIPNFLFDGVSEALQRTKARVVYVANLMTKCGQTDDMTVSDHVEILTRYAGRVPDVVLINSEEPDSDLVERYQKERECLVSDDYDGEAVRIPMLAKAPEQHAADVARRSLVRHDPDKLAMLVTNLL